MSENEYDTMCDNSVSSDNGDAIINADSAADTNGEYEIHPWWPIKKEASHAEY